MHSWGIKGIVLKAVEKSNGQQYLEDEWDGIAGIAEREVGLKDAEKSNAVVR